MTTAAFRQLVADLPVTTESVVAAKHAAHMERMRIFRETGIVIDDDGRIALTLGNAIAAAVYGPRGEYRDREM